MQHHGTDARTKKICCNHAPLQWYLEPGEVFLPLFADGLMATAPSYCGRLNGAYNRLAQQAADSHRRAQDNTALAKKCADLREANTRLVEQLSASRESEEAAVKTMQTKVNGMSSIVWLQMVSRVGLCWSAQRCRREWASFLVFCRC